MSTATTTKWQPNDEQREILLALQAEAAKEKTVVEFARNYLPFGRSMFDQIMDVFDPKVPESYFDRITPARIGTLFPDLQNILAEIPLKRLEKSRIKQIDIIETSKIAALVQAVREAGEKSGPERIVVNLGPTGGGKTMTCNHLVKKCNARIVEVRDIWRDSRTGYVPLKDICRAVDLRCGEGNDMAWMQDELIRFCGERKIVLAFDESEHFGRAAMNLLKLVTNRTRIVPVLFCVPREYDKWSQWFPNEAGQLARRTHAIIDSTIISAEDAGLFFPKGQFADRDDALPKIAAEASRFGHFSLIARLATKLDGIAKVTSKTTGDEESDLAKFLRSVKAQMLRENKAK